MQGLAISLAGHEVRLLAQRALHWPAASTLMVADVHLGKGAAFAALGRAVPAAVGEADLARLGALLRATGAERLIVLGDLFHARSGMVAHTLDTLRAWRDVHAGLAIDLIRGNHDQQAGDPPPGLNIRCVTGPTREGPWVLAHEPDAADEAPRDGGYRLCGHVHPVAKLAGPGGTGARVPCFVAGVTRLVLPAFGGFTGGGPACTRDGDRVFAIAGEEVIEVPVLRVHARARARAPGSRS